MTRPPDLKEIDAEVDQLNKEKEEAVANQDFEKAAALRDQADKLKKEKTTNHQGVARKIS
jgi:ATP-dependent Clp protease ATP-binding subunit ClpC